MSKHDLQARPIYHHTRESIEAHLSIVFAALAVSHWIEHQTGWSIKKFVRTARRYRTVQIKAGGQILTAADPLPDDLNEALTKIGSHLNTKLSQVGSRRERVRQVLRLSDQRTEPVLGRDQASAVSREGVSVTTTKAYGLVAERRRATVKPESTGPTTSSSGRNTSLKNTSLNSGDFKPRELLEIGSGFSTYLAAQAIQDACVRRQLAVRPAGDPECHGRHGD